MEDDECRDFFMNGPARRIEFFRSMTNLRILDICLQSYDLDYFDMKSMFRGIQWPRLREVALNYLHGTVEDLLNFLRKHAATLKIIQLSNYKLTQGLWLYTFREMREILSLENFRIVGRLQNEGHGEKDAWHRQQQTIRDYLQGSQAVNLGDIIDYGENCSCQVFQRVTKFVNCTLSAVLLYNSQPKSRIDGPIQQRLWDFMTCSTMATMSAVGTNQERIHIPLPLATTAAEFSKRSLGRIIEPPKSLRRLQSLSSSGLPQEI